MIRVLFVCYGNICRSPMAEFMMKDFVEKKRLGDSFEIASAGTSSEEIFGGVGNPVHPSTRDELARHGISCAGKRARQLTRADYDYYDYLVAMDGSNLRNIKRLMNGDPDNKVFRLLDLSNNPRDVDDPWYTGDFEQTWNDIEEGLPLLLSKIRLEKKI